MICNNLEITSELLRKKI